MASYVHPVHGLTASNIDGSSFGLLPHRKQPKGPPSASESFSATKFPQDLLRSEVLVVWAAGMTQGVPLLGPGAQGASPGL